MFIITVYHINYYVKQNVFFKKILSYQYLLQPKRAKFRIMCDECGVLFTVLATL